jgi:regulator of replication initiation timing
MTPTAELVGLLKDMADTIDNEGFALDSEVPDKAAAALEAMEAQMAFTDGLLNSAHEKYAALRAEVSRGNDLLRALTFQNSTLQTEVAKWEDSKWVKGVIQERNDAQAERDALLIRLDNAKGQIEDAYSTLDLMRAELSAIKAAGEDATEYVLALENKRLRAELEKAHEKAGELAAANAGQRMEMDDLRAVLAEIILESETWMALPTTVAPTFDVDNCRKRIDGWKAAMNTTNTTEGTT